MRKWAALTVLLYAFTLLLLTMPVLMIAFGNWAKDPVDFQGALKVYGNWGYWVWLGALLAGQLLLLSLPINISERRLPSRRPLRVPVIVAGFFLGALSFAGLLAILCAAFEDERGLVFFSHLSLFGDLLRFSGADAEARSVCAGMIVSVFVFWALWAFIFGSFAKSDDPNAFIHRATGWLLRGSILELLIAVPSHIIVRRRGDCCAPIGTFWGITTGISVMLLCFGPGVFFLVVERFRRLQPKSATAASESAAPR